jgi:predicted GIY-YIG superfamily endonuclease
MAIVYRHIRKDKNEPFYIGIANDKYRPYRIHGRNNIWKKIVSKSDYEVEILFDDISREEACEKEKEFISLYGRINNSTGILSNLTDGGDGTVGYKYTKIQKENMAKSHKGMLGLTHNEETISKMKITHTGVSFTDERKEKIRLSKLGKSVNKGVSKSEEHKRKIAESLKGRKLSEETKLKISNTLKNK